MNFRINYAEMATWSIDIADFNRAILSQTVVFLSETRVLSINPVSKYYYCCCYFWLSVLSHRNVVSIVRCHNLIMYNVSQKVQHFLFMTLPNVGRFLTFFHIWIKQEICNKIVVICECVAESKDKRILKIGQHLPYEWIISLVFFDSILYPPLGLYLPSKGFSIPWEVVEPVSRKGSKTFSKGIH